MDKRGTLGRIAPRVAPGIAPRVASWAGPRIASRLTARVVALALLGAAPGALAFAAPAAAEMLRGGLALGRGSHDEAARTSRFPAPPPAPMRVPASTSASANDAFDPLAVMRGAALRPGEGAATATAPPRSPSPPPAIRRSPASPSAAAPSPGRPPSGDVRSPSRPSARAVPRSPARAAARPTDRAVAASADAAGAPAGAGGTATSPPPRSPLPRSLATRPVPHGERLPGMRGVLARSLVLGELRRAGDAASPGAPAGLGDIVGAIVGAIGEDADADARAETGVGDTVRAALVVDDGLRASLARADAAAHRVGAARGAMLPKLDLEASAGSRSPLTAWEEATYSTARAVLTIPVFASGANIATMRAARASADAAALSHLAEERVAVLEAATAHLDLHAARAVERALAANARGMVETLAASRALFAAGEASLADVAVAEANLESARGELAAGRQALDRARTEYRVRTGRPAPASLRAPDTDGLVPLDVERAVEAALRGPDVEAGFRRADAARHDARAALGRAGPRVDLTASYGHRIDAIEEPDGAYDASVGVRLTVPLIDFETVPDVRAARADARASEYAARDAARDAERRVRNAHAAHAGAMARQAAAQRRAGAMERALEATRAEYRAGFRTVTDVVRARVGLARARIDLANAARDRHRAAYTVGVMTGKVAPGR